MRHFQVSGDDSCLNKRGLCGVVFWSKNMKGGVNQQMEMCQKILLFSGETCVLFVVVKNLCLDFKLVASARQVMGEGKLLKIYYIYWQGMRTQLLLFLGCLVYQNNKMKPFAKWGGGKMKCGYRTQCGGGVVLHGKRC